MGEECLRDELRTLFLFEHLTDDQLDIIAGKRDQLAGTIQEEYGISKDETEKQLNAFEKRYKDWDPRA